MQVNDGLVSCREDGLVFKQLQGCNLSLKLGHDGNGRHHATENKAWLNFLLVDATQLKSQVLSWSADFDINLIPKRLLDLARDFIWHHHQLCSHFANPGLDFTHDHGTSVAILIHNGHSERLVIKSIYWLKVVEHIKQRTLVPPWAGLLGYRVLDVGPGQSRDRNKHDILLQVVSALLEERAKASENLVVSLLAPLASLRNRRVVHLVHDNNELGDTERLGQLSVLPRLPTSLETCLELALTGSNDEHANVSLRGTPNHVWHVVLMSGGVQDCVSLLVRLEVRSSHLDRLSFRALLVVRIHDVSHVPTVSVLLLGLSLVFLYRPVVHVTRLEQDLPTESGFSSVDVTNEHDVDVLLLLPKGLELLQELLLLFSTCFALFATRLRFRFGRICLRLWARLWRRRSRSLFLCWCGSRSGTRSGSSLRCWWCGGRSCRRRLEGSSTGVEAKRTCVGIQSKPAGLLRRLWRVRLVFPTIAHNC
mmetsp:Transcript_8346/g.15432  ORF Transcript_8346/g.15432 Transcript_8346/m.15432 type:complete len:478 (+) Transcript_8346:275-1708(+)